MKVALSHTQSIVCASAYFNPKLNTSQIFKLRLQEEGVGGQKINF